MPKIGNVTEEWTDGGVNDFFVGDITDTSSSSASTLINLKVDGTSKFSVDKAGNLSFAGTLDASTLNWSVPQRGARVSLTSSVTSFTSGTISWGQADKDSDSIWSAGNPTRLTVPTGVTKVRLRANVRCESAAEAGSIYCTIEKDGAAFAGAPTSSVRESATGTTFNTVNIQSATVDVTAGEYFTLFVSLSGFSNVDQVLASSFTWFEMEIVEVTDAENRPYDIGTFIGGKPSTSTIYLGWSAPRAVRIPADFSGAAVKARVAATAQTDFDLQVDGASIGTMRFAAAADTPTFVGVSQEDMDKDGYFDVVSPASQDATLADISMTFPMQIR